MKMPDRKTIVMVLAGMMLLSIVVWWHMSTSRHRLEQPAAQETAQESPLNETAMRPAAGTRHATRKAHGKFVQKAARPADRADPGSFEDPYICNGDCPPGYDVFSTTGSEEEARWLHAAGFPTPEEYESMTRDEAAVADARRRALAGDSRAAGILAAYYLEQKDYSETLTMATHGSAACNVYALRVNAQFEVERARDRGNILAAATDLQIAYLLGDQDAALDLGSLLRATNMGREVIGTLTDSIMRPAAGILDDYRQMNPLACQYHGLRPVPR